MRTVLIIVLIAGFLLFIVSGTIGYIRYIALRSRSNDGSLGLAAAVTSPGMVVVEIKARPDDTESISKMRRDLRRAVIAQCAAFVLIAAASLILLDW